MSTLAGKRLVVTGGRSGIGADLACCALTDEGVAELRAEVEGLGRRLFFDVSDETALLGVAVRARTFLGGIDGLVNNDGTNFFRGVPGATRADIARCLDMDFYPAWTLWKALDPGLSAASVHAERTEVGAFPYNAAKAALVALTRSQALEWGTDGIRAVAVVPGLIDTALVGQRFDRFPDPAAMRAVPSAAWAGPRT